MPGAHLSRTELAEAVNAWLLVNTDRPGILDDAYVARLERGRIRWPNSDYRAAFRAVLGATSDAGLGFRPSAANRRPVRTATALPNPSANTPAASPDAPGETPSNVPGIRAIATAFQTADRRLGGGALYGSVLRYLTTEIGPRLVDAEGPAGSELFAAAASLTEIAGWMAHDGGDDTAARNHFERAYRLASAADHVPLIANVCASMSHLAVELNEPAEAVRIAEVGLSKVPRTSGTSQLAARLHAMRARALAATGATAATVSALSEAERALSVTDNDPSPDWIARFDQASLASETATCLRQLGDLDGARRQAECVIELRVGDRVRSRAFGHLTLAELLADAGRVDEAATLGAEVCRATVSLASARVRRRLEALGAAVRPHATVPEVRAFLHMLEPDVTRSERYPRWPV
ncbi:hypothetical protein [Actinophytocola xanthii]|uniref:Transcriptional regulator n=1 Tax=Actinophytocola xanthii TaxID=1912961 RepID=A0A1Q8CPV8_9PSEU|nr:hypothetical protein [Actinophytocola xanthii]OLF16395.1 hypothetical protein BU204_16180 [Actinophytocola xanthii]